MPQYSCIIDSNGKLPPAMARSLTDKIKELAGKQVFISIAEVKNPDKDILEFLDKWKK